MSNGSNPRGERAGDPILRPIGTPTRGFLATVPPDVLAFLDAPRYAVVATHGPDGEVWQAVVWYAVAEDVILLNSLLGRRWSDNLDRDPRLSMVVFEGEDYVILRGRAVTVDAPEHAMAEARALAHRYGGDPDAHEGQHRLRIVFRPDRASTHGRFPPIRGEGPTSW